MISALKAFFSDLQTSSDSGPQQQHTIELASAALLIDLCKTDSSIDEVELQQNNHEIDDAYWVPMSQLLSDDTYRQEWVEYEGSKYRTDVFQVGGDRIWGATGIMIKNLLERLSSVLGKA